MEDIVKRFNEWKGDGSPDDICDNIFEFANKLGRGDLCFVFESLEELVEKAWKYDELSK